MKIHTSDKVIAWLTLFSGLSISAVAVYYSVAGLVSIFAAAAIPIMIMGVALEVSKLVATVWLKLNWSRAPRLIRTYLFTAIAILMIITSMGIFGYLSKAHLDQAVPTGDVADKVALIDEKIKTQKENIDASRKALKQMDESVDQVMARSTDEKGADKAAALRRNQTKERTALQNDIAKAQKEISVLNDERAPIAKELRKVEAEVGPIKYIAALLYGDNPDQNILEKAVRAVIIIIVLVFDPLAVILLLASQYSFMWFRKDEEEEATATTWVDEQAEDLTEAFNQLDKELEEPLEVHPDEGTAEEPITPFYGTPSPHWPFPSFHNDAPKEPVEEPKEEPVEEPEEADIVEQVGVEQWNTMIAEAEKAIEEEEDQAEINSVDDEAEKEAMRRWKADNPGVTVKFHRDLYSKGAIDELPWSKYLKAEADFGDDEAAEEAAKWALEQLEESKKKESMSWIEKVGNQQVKKTKE